MAFNPHLQEEEQCVTSLQHNTSLSITSTSSQPTRDDRATFHAAAAAGQEEEEAI